MIYLIFPLIFIAQSLQCIISGKESGYCAYKPLSPQSFCASQISSYVCVPAHNKTWAEYNATYKDQTVETVFMQFFQQQLIDEYTNKNASLRLTNNPACYNAYWQFLCNWNFPACRPNMTSQPMCISLCTSFYSNCGGNTEACSILFESIDLGVDQTC